MEVTYTDERQRERDRELRQTKRRKAFFWVVVGFVASELLNAHRLRNMQVSVVIDD